MPPAQILRDIRTQPSPALKQGVQEDYEGNYRFAPIEEAQVARAMIKRLVSLLEVVKHARKLKKMDTGTSILFTSVSSRTLS